MESAIDRYLTQIQSVLDDDDVAAAELLSGQLDELIRQMCESGELDEGQLTQLSSSLEYIYNRVLSIKKGKLSEASKITKGQAGIRAYKGSL